MDNGGGGFCSHNEQNTSVNTKKKGKKICHRHTPEQIQRLEAYFKECPHPDEGQRYKLCKELKLEPDQIKFWFQNKRTQSKVQDERSSNVLLRGENERIQNENEALLDALKNVICPTCGGPPFGAEERERNLQKLRLENALLKEKRDEMVNFLTKQNQPTMVDPSFATIQNHQQIFDPHFSQGINPNHLFDTSRATTSQQTNQPQQLSEIEIMQLTEIAASAIEELKTLFLTEDPFWIKSSIDGTYVIDQGSYEKYLHATRHFKNVSARVESSKDFTVVPIEATHLIEMFLDTEKWIALFPTIVNKAKTIHMLGSNLPMQQNCNVLQVIWEQLHILSPLVAPREFMILRCCQELEQGLWIVADVSHNVVDFDIVNASCYKRPSGCLIQALPNAISKVMWIEHVEVDDKSETHPMYRELLCGRSGYGAKRWIATLERMCERIALFSMLTIPANDWSEIITTGVGRRNIMKVGERMLKSFNEMLTMSGKVDFPQHSKSGVRVSIRMNIEEGEPTGLIVSAACSLPIPLPPFHIFDVLRHLPTRQQWDALSFTDVVPEIARVATGSSETNYVSIVKPVNIDDYGKMVFEESDQKQEMVMLQDCFMDELGGMLVYAPIDVTSMKKTVSGQHHPNKTEILPSGFIISNNGSIGQRSNAAAASTSTAPPPAGVDGSLLTVGFQILVSSRGTRSRGDTEKCVDTVSGLISRTVQNIKSMLNVSSSY